MMTIGKSPILLHHHVIFLLLLVLQVSGQHQPRTTAPPCWLVVFVTNTQAHLLMEPALIPKRESWRSSVYKENKPWTWKGCDKFVSSFLYSQVKGLKIGKGGVECAICLNEFEEEETLRLMPPCSHAFHASCIDVWLSSRSTCPVCRAGLPPKPGSDQSSLYRFIRPHDNQDMDLENVTARRSVLESPDVRLLDRLSWSNNTGAIHRLDRENLDRFTLQLPEEVRRQLSHMKTLPQARVQEKAIGVVALEAREGFPYGRRYNRRNISLSFSFSFQTTLFNQEKAGKKSLVKGFDRLKPEMV
ncbi:hypothetical protein AXX17_AT1G36050 [Arabidopsis thaliana]|uniref:RING-type E3 ubiquitin transferase n=1 Tax=Arabidopsis thaliana TaxID=3702 RepID=A0A178W9Y9_ARATH|nr:hypothetical protein AXX17_AT1G36050 [Arabidopsis thaliana]